MPFYKNRSSYSVENGLEKGKAEGFREQFRQEIMVSWRKVVVVGRWREWGRSETWRRLQHSLFRGWLGREGEEKTGVLERVQTFR